MKFIEEFGTITEIKDDGDYEIAKMQASYLDVFLDRHFLFENIIITTRPKDYTVEITLDVPSEFYHDHMLDDDTREFDYEGLGDLCSFAKTHQRLKDEGLLDKSYAERDRLRLLIHDYNRKKLIQNTKKL